MAEGPPRDKTRRIFVFTITDGDDDDGSSSDHSEDSGVEAPENSNMLRLLTTDSSDKAANGPNHEAAELPCQGPLLCASDQSAVAGSIPNTAASKESLDSNKMPAVVGTTPYTAASEESFDSKTLPAVVGTIPYIAVQNESPSSDDSLDDEGLIPNVTMTVESCDNHRISAVAVVGPTAIPSRPEGLVIDGVKKVIFSINPEVVVTSSPTEVRADVMGSIPEATDRLSYWRLALKKACYAISHAGPPPALANRATQKPDGKDSLPLASETPSGATILGPEESYEDLFTTDPTFKDRALAYLSKECPATADKISKREPFDLDTYRDLSHMLQAVPRLQGAEQKKASSSARPSKTQHESSQSTLDDRSPKKKLSQETYFSDLHAISRAGESYRDIVRTEEMEFADVVFSYLEKKDPVTYDKVVDSDEVYRAIIELGRASKLSPSTWEKCLDKICQDAIRPRPDSTSDDGCPQDEIPTVRWKNLEHDDCVSSRIKDSQCRPLSPELHNHKKLDSSYCGQCCDKVTYHIPVDWITSMRRTGIVINNAHIHQAVTAADYLIEALKVEAPGGSFAPKAMAGTTIYDLAVHAFLQSSQQYDQVEAKESTQVIHLIKQALCAAVGLCQALQGPEGLHPIHKTVGFGSLHTLAFKAFVEAPISGCIKRVMGYQTSDSCMPHPGGATEKDPKPEVLGLNPSTDPDFEEDSWSPPPREARDFFSDLGPRIKFPEFDNIPLFYPIPRGWIDKMKMKNIIFTEDQVHQATEAADYLIEALRAIDSDRASPSLSDPVSEQTSIYDMAIHSFLRHGNGYWDVMTTNPAEAVVSIHLALEAAVTLHRHLMECYNDSPTTGTVEAPRLHELAFKTFVHLFPKYSSESLVMRSYNASEKPPKRFRSNPSRPVLSGKPDCSSSSDSDSGSDSLPSLVSMPSTKPKGLDNKGLQEDPDTSYQRIQDLNNLTPGQLWCLAKVMEKDPEENFDQIFEKLQRRKAAIKAANMPAEGQENSLFSAYEFDLLSIVRGLPVDKRQTLALFLSNQAPVDSGQHGRKNYFQWHLQALEEMSSQGGHRPAVLQTFQEMANESETILSDDAQWWGYNPRVIDEMANVARQQCDVICENVNYSAIAAAEIDHINYSLTQGDDGPYRAQAHHLCVAEIQTRLEMAKHIIQPEKQPDKSTIWLRAAGLATDVAKHMGVEVVDYSIFNSTRHAQACRLKTLGGLCLFYAKQRIIPDWTLMARLWCDAKYAETEGTEYTSVVRVLAEALSLIQDTRAVSLSHLAVNRAAHPDPEWDQVKAVPEPEDLPATAAASAIADDSLEAQCPQPEPEPEPERPKCPRIPRPRQSKESHSGVPPPEPPLAEPEACHVIEPSASIMATMESLQRLLQTTAIVSNHQHDRIQDLMAQYHDHESFLLIAELYSSLLKGLADRINHQLEAFVAQLAGEYNRPH